MPQKLTDNSGKIIWANYEFAWGGWYIHFYKEQSLNNCDILEHELQPIRFQGQFFDVETGLHYNRFRYYDSDVGMFIQRDPIGLLGGVNVFAYAPNPVGWVDPWGLCCCTETNKKIHMGAQGKHIIGHNNYVEGKSIITKDPQNLLDNYYSGKIQSSRIINESKVKVDFGSIIGVHIDPVTKIKTPTSSAIIHTGKKGAHIVPALPDTR